MISRKIWFLGKGKYSQNILGPLVRVIEMAKFAQANGWDPVIALDSIDAIPPSNISMEKISTSTLDRICKQDHVIISPFISYKILHQLFKKNICFDVDFYCIGALENLESEAGISKLRLSQGRRRTALRYEYLIKYSRRIYVSNNEQVTFLGGMLFQTGKYSSCKVASRLPEKTIIAPMGIPSHPFPTGSESPYPEEIRNKQIILWGGGIWSWFDIDTLLLAFQELHRKNSNAVLFFLCGNNPSELSNQNSAIQKAILKSTQLGLLGKNIHFNTGSVPLNKLPPFLEHCFAGIMTNPPRLESIASWRTRLLDLIWAGKPVFTAGSDPISDQMAKNGVAKLVATKDHQALAKAIQTSLSDAFFHKSVLENYMSFRQEMTWDTCLNAWISDINKETNNSNQNDHRISYIDMFRYILGI